MRHGRLGAPTKARPDRGKGVAPFDPRNTWHVLFVTLLTMVVLGWFVWIWANWPNSVIFVMP